MALKSFLDTHSRAVNIAAFVLTLLVSLVCYILIILLFVSPSTLHLQSLLRPGAKGIKPTTAITLLAAVLAAATASLINRAVEQSLWLKLAPRNVRNMLTVGESRRLAQWSVSPLAKVFYVFNGDRWLLKPVGIMVVALAVVGPVLVSGISQALSTNTSTENLDHTSDPWTGWIDVANEAYNGGNFRDVPGITAGFAYLSNLSAPASSICTDPDCTVTAVTASIRASCQTRSSSHAQMFNANLPQWINETHFSSLDPNASVVLSSGSPYIYTNFTSWSAPGCETGTLDPSCGPGTFAIIFGAFVNNTDNLNGPCYLNTIDCLLTFGTVSVTQNGGNTPTLDSSSFAQNASSVGIPSTIVSLHRIYIEDPYYTSQYAFSGGTGTGDGSDSLFNYPLASLLLGPKADSSGEQVADRIEKIFEMTTLMAFAKAPRAADLAITTTSSTPVYVYKRAVLAVLLLPFVAAVLGMWGRCKIRGKDVCVGYDPVEIATWGPVNGLSGVGGEKVEEKHIWSFTENLANSSGERIVKNRFAVD
ncbi:hypothetical protein IQ07DRAFT_668749 [Pyrenochaeta sp. DS3sAY3a]|nr:hypothetical protein IQ07DRAFT_668749 [Pyrenochaeta sp. DS3sAY3a]